MTRRQALAPILAGGDRRSTGASAKTARRMATDDLLVGEAILLMSHHDPIVAMRAADALEKASRSAPVMLQPHRARLLRIARRSDQPELVWHLAQMLPRLRLTSRQANTVGAWLARVFESAGSRIARANALEGLVTLAAHHPGVRSAARQVLKSAAGSPVPAIAARARRLARRGAGAG